MAYDVQPRPAHNPAADRSLGELFAELTRETSTLVRQEVELAKAEVKQKATEAGKDVGMIAAGGALAYAGLIVLLGALALLLVQVGLAPWLATLIIAVVAMGVGGFMAMRGLSGLRSVDPVPRQTMETLKEDVQTLKGQR